jgi:enoyl-CoA hydratase/carnithine racemase
MRKFILRRLFSSSHPLPTEFKNLIVNNQDRTSIIQINRPKALNALNNEVIAELNLALKSADADPEIHTIIITGNEKAFAAGADIKEMADKTYDYTYSNKMLEDWNYVYSVRKPTIAAVSGYALGGGFELALMCDMIVASTTAKFGLPEVTLGTIPGAGGTQRLIREIGKAKALQMILTGEFINAEEAQRLGLVVKIAENALEESKLLSQKINKFSSLTTSMAKDAVKAAYELPIKQGIEYEKRLFWSTFATEDQKEGMTAFKEKRAAVFKNK